MFDKKVPGSFVFILCMCLVVLPGLGVTAQANDSQMDASVLAAQTPAIPAAADWDAGTPAFSHGAAGAWDHILWGGFAQSLIKKGDTYYLYYQGSSSYDDQCESVSQRSIGVATSTDGIHWKKHANNPVITWSSQGSIEEGAASSAAWVGADNKIYLYYGANTGSGCNVTASARLAVSGDGVNFQDAGEVLSGKDPDVWGAGDEIFPVGAYAYGNTWNVYYIPNGVPQSRKLGVARGSRSDLFTQTGGVNQPEVDAWGPVSVVVNGTASLLFTNPQGGNGPLNIYQFNAGDPSSVKLYDSYDLSNCSQAVVLQDPGAGRWLMACRDTEGSSYIVRQAPFKTFADVPLTHPYWEDIEILYANGLTGGCSASPLKFCPDQIMNRAQAAAFMLRGNFGSSYVPPAPTHIFQDDWTKGPWAEPWAEAMRNKGLSAGCLANPPKYCPWDQIPREQAVIFALRLKYGQSYTPPPATGTVFADLANPSYYATAWAEQAYKEGIIQNCGMSGGSPKICPKDLVSRGLAAYMIVRAKSLTMP